MNLESNLIKVNGGMYSLGGNIIARSRVNVTEATDVTAIILDFLQKNLEFLTPNIKNEAFIRQLESRTTLSIEEIAELNYVLADNGYLMTNFCVADLEINSNEVPDNTMEYNIVDNTRINFQFIPFATKIAMDLDKMSVYQLYSKINELYNLFSSDLFADVPNPIKNDLISIDWQERPTGSVNTALTDHINNTLRFIGKEIYTIYN